MPPHDPPRSSEQILRKLMRPKKVGSHIQDDAIFHPEELMGLGDKNQSAPELDGTAIGGGCQMWCVPQHQTDCYGERQHRLVPGAQAPCTPLASDQDPEGDMFESTRLGLALEQLLIERTTKLSSPSAALASSRRPAPSRRSELSLHPGAPPPQCKRSVGMRGPRTSPPAQWQSPEAIGLAGDVDTTPDLYRAAAVQRGRPIPERGCCVERGFFERPPFTERGPGPEPRSDGVLGAGESSGSAAPRSASACEVGRRAAPRTTSRCRDTSADDVIRDILGVHCRRRSMLGDNFFDEPTVREPHAVLLSRLPKWLEPAKQHASVSGMFHSRNDNDSHGPGRGDTTSSASQRSRSANGGISQAELQAVLQRMPLPNVIADPL